MGDTSYTAADVIDALGNSSDAGDGDGYVDWWEVKYSSDLPTDIGVIKLVDESGGEGQGDHMHIVIQVEASGQYFRIDGYYSSYGESEFDGELREVQLVERTVKFYE